MGLRVILDAVVQKIISSPCPNSNRNPRSSNMLIIMHGWYLKEMSTSETAELFAFG
jgi:hypothetical protein